MNETANWTWHEFATPGELAEALAARIGGELREAVAERGTSLLALSGGKTPEQFLQGLSEQSLPWEKVTVILVDERFVKPSSNRSNEKLIGANLLRGEAAQAKFVGMFSPAPTVEEAADAADRRLRHLPFPVDVAVLGMGLDGHTASFFPEAENLGGLLDPSSEQLVMPVHAASAGEPRLTLSLASLVESGFLALHIEGNAKRDLLRSAIRQPFDDAPPVLSVISHATHPVQIYWAPNEDEIP